MDGSKGITPVKAPRRTSLRQLEREMRARDFFRWHAQQHFVETGGGFRLTAKYPTRDGGKGHRADSLNHPRGGAASISIWVKVEKIRECESLT
jgi:hypothetical protein